MSRRIGRTELIEIKCCWNCGSRQFLTIEEAAEACGVSINTIYTWMKRGVVEWVYNLSGRRLVYLESLVRRSLLRAAAAAPHAPEAA
ncbi:MAG: DNA-binding protein [Acidobacteria bacterium]|nr:MAG: DNA-binding protein [Acidobacteriota bacterium]